MCLFCFNTVPLFFLVCLNWLTIRINRFRYCIRYLVRSIDKISLASLASFLPFYDPVCIVLWFCKVFFYFILFSISVVGCFLFDWRDIFGSANVTSKQVPAMMNECALFSFCVEIYENWRWWLCKLVFWSSAVEQFLWFVFFLIEIVNSKKRWLRPKWFDRTFH